MDDKLSGFANAPAAVAVDLEVAGGLLSSFEAALLTERFLSTIISAGPDPFA